MIPGLERAEFARLGGLHRNTFINSPRLLDRELRLRARPHVRFAGQITGVEGYVESAAIGLLAGRFAAAAGSGADAAAAAARRPRSARCSATSRAAPRPTTFQPMNVNFGLFPPLAGSAKRAERKPALARRALADLDGWLAALAKAA